MEKKLVFVEWEDAVVRPNITTQKESVNSKTLILQQVGFLVYEDKNKVVLAWQLNPDDGKFRHTETIPTRSIVRIIELPFPKLD